MESVNLYKVFPVPDSVVWVVGVFLLLIFTSAKCDVAIGEPKNLPPTKMLEVFKQQFEKTSFPALKKTQTFTTSACLAL